MLAATILTGIIQVVLGYLKVGKLIKYIPRPVILGFVNALGILMFKSQLEHFKGTYIPFRYGYLVTTSPQSSVPPSAAPSLRLGH